MVFSGIRMDVVSLCPLRVALLPWQPRPGAFAATVICKATFELRPGASPMASAQEPPWDTPSVTDMVPFKRRADVFVIGHAYAPQKHQRTVTARLAVGNVDKSIEVRADRGWLAEDFGPLPSKSPMRVAMLGEHAVTWNHRAWNRTPLPGNIDGAYFNAAPADQQLTELAGDERMVLEHLHPVYPRLETRLASVVPRARVERADGQQEIRLRCDTLCIDTVRRVAMLVWRGVVLLANDSEEGRIIVMDASRAGSNVEAALAMTAPVNPTRAQKVVIPFSQESGGESGGGVDWAATTLLQHPVDVKPAVPFVPGATNLPLVAPRIERATDDISATKPLWYAGVATVLKPVTPFETKVPPRTIPDEPSPPPLDDTGPLPDIETAEVETAEVETSRPVVEEPPMIGPIPVAPRASESEGTVAEENARPAEAVQEVTEAPPVELSIERYAEIKAELAENGVDRAQVLAERGLHERDWTHNARRWKQAIDEEALLGEQDLRDRYDAAYVARVEGFRGPISVEEYARIMVALERGRPKRVLDELRIQHEALMPIVRRWTKKVARDNKLGDAAMQAMRAMRRGR